MQMALEVEASEIRVGDEIMGRSAVDPHQAPWQKITVVGIDHDSMGMFLWARTNPDTTLMFIPVGPGWSGWTQPEHDPRVTVTREATCANCDWPIRPSRSGGEIYHERSPLYGPGTPCRTPSGLSREPNKWAQLPSVARWAREATSENAREGGTREVPREVGTRDGLLLRAGLMQTLRDTARELLRRIEEITEEIEDEYRERAGRV